MNQCRFYDDSMYAECINEVSMKYQWSTPSGITSGTPSGITYRQSYNSDLSV